MSTLLTGGVGEASALGAAVGGLAGHDAVGEFAAEDLQQQAQHEEDDADRDVEGLPGDGEEKSYYQQDVREGSAEERAHDGPSGAVD